MIALFEHRSSLALDALEVRLGGSPSERGFHLTARRREFHVFLRVSDLAARVLVPGGHDLTRGRSKTLPNNFPIRLKISRIG